MDVFSLPTEQCARDFQHVLSIGGAEERQPLLPQQGGTANVYNADGGVVRPGRRLRAQSALSRQPGYTIQETDGRRPVSDRTKQKQGVKYGDRSSRGRGGAEGVILEVPQRGRRPRSRTVEPAMKLGIEKRYKSNLRDALQQEDMRPLPSKSIHIPDEGNAISSSSYTESPTCTSSTSNSSFLSPMGSYMNSVGAGFDYTPSFSRAFVRVTPAHSRRRKQSVKGNDDDDDDDDGDDVSSGRPSGDYTSDDVRKEGVKGEEEWEIEGEVSEEEVLMELYGRKGWRYNRYFVTFLASLPIFIGILATTLYLPAFNVVRDDPKLNTTDVWVSASVTITAVASGTTPILYGPLCDRYGRRALLLGCLPLVVAGSVLAGLSSNIYMLIAGRCVMGLGMGADAVAGLGAMSDVWPSDKRSQGITLILLPAVIAPIIASPLGGFLAEEYSWRWCCLLPGFLCILLYMAILPLFPETLPSKVAPDQSSSIQAVLPASRPPPRNPLSFLLNPRISLIALSSAFIMASLSLAAILQAPILQDEHPDIQPGTLGLYGLPLGVGTLFGAVLGGVLAEKGYRWRGDGGRLLFPYITGMLSAVAIVAYGFTIQRYLVIGLTMSGVLGALVPASRPGMYAYAIGQVGRQYFSQNILLFPSTEVIFFQR